MSLTAIPTFGASPWLPKQAARRSPCSALVGWPVLGPPRCTLTTTSGISHITARPRASCLREKPGAGGNRVHRPPLHTRGEDAGGKRGVAVHHDLRLRRSRCGDVVLEIELRLGPLEACFEQCQVGLDHLLVLLAEVKCDFLPGELQVGAFK